MINRKQHFQSKVQLKRDFTFTVQEEGISQREKY